MIEVFKTNISSKSKAEETLQLLNSRFPGYVFHFDLEDCDNILRIESKNGALKIKEIEYLFSSVGILAEILPD